MDNGISLNGEVLARQRMASRVMAGRAFMIKTPPAMRYARELTTWLGSGSHGAIVYGRPRLGKSLGTRWVLGALPAILGSVPWLEVPMRDQKHASEREFFQHMLHCARHKHYLPGTAGDKRDRWTEWLYARAIRSPVNTFVLFIDEAQQMRLQHYQWLLNIGNELDQRGCRLFCLLVGQAQLLADKARLIDSGQEQIVGRFMVRELEYVGIRSMEEMADCFHQYQVSKYPAGSETLFPAHFIPKAMANNFQLKQIVEATWNAFEAHWKSGGFGGHAIIPMHYLTSTLISLLNKLVKDDQANLMVASTLISRCVKESGYVESLLALKAQQ